MGQLPSYGTRTIFVHNFGVQAIELEGLIGGPCRDRTYDQLIKSQLLYQLSYVHHRLPFRSIWRARQESNLQPPA